MRLRTPAVVAAPRKWHGLGNRLRSVLGSLSLAEHEGRAFAYSWPTGSAFGARLDELWRFDHPRVSEARLRLLTLRHPFRTADLEWRSAAADDPIWVIRTPHALALPTGARPWGELFRSLPLAPGLARRVSDFHGRHLAEAPYVGVMIRTHPHSHAETLERSPLEWYAARMRHIRAMRPGVRFFVSADTEAARDAILDEFEGAFSQTDKGGYNTEAALLSSVVDLYLLAGAGHILAPHYSSFPELAVQLAGPALRLETSMTPPDRRLADDDVLDRVEDPLLPSRRVPAGSSGSAEPEAR